MAHDTPGGKAPILRRGRLLALLLLLAVVACSDQATRARLAELRSRGSAASDELRQGVVAAYEDLGAALVRAREAFAKPSP